MALVAVLVKGGIDRKSNGEQGREGQQGNATVPMHGARCTKEGCHCSRAIGLASAFAPDMVSGDVGRQIVSARGNLHFCQGFVRLGLY